METEISALIFHVRSNMFFVYVCVSKWVRESFFFFFVRSEIAIKYHIHVILKEVRHLIAFSLITENENRPARPWQTDEIKTSPVEWTKAFFFCLFLSTHEMTSNYRWLIDSKVKSLKWKAPDVTKPCKTWSQSSW